MPESDTFVSTLLMNIGLPHVPQFGPSRSMTSSGGRVFSLLATITPEMLALDGGSKGEVTARAKHGTSNDIEIWKRPHRLQFASRAHSKKGSDPSWGSRGHCCLGPLRQRRLETPKPYYWESRMRSGPHLTLTNVCRIIFTVFAVPMSHHAQTSAASLYKLPRLCIPTF
jgi:hypothetical protein